MKRLQIPLRVILALLLILGGGAWLASQHLRPSIKSAAGRATYYCPMHPTYTSDRPGDCPICYMKLVKRETAIPQPPAPRPSPPQNTLKDICYLHNCPKLHEGQVCPMTVVAKAGEPVTCPVCGTHVASGSPQATRKILYWTDPMIPGYRSDKPGKSPMGMDLVPVYAESGDAVPPSAAVPEGYAAILVSPRKQQLIGVKTASVARRPMTKTIRTVGVVAHDLELYQAQAELIQAQRAWEQASTGGNPDVAEGAKRLLESSRLRLRHLGLSEELIDEVSAWTAPDHRLLVGGGGQVWVYASIYESELPLVESSQPATVEANAWPGRAWPGTVKAIDPMVDQMTRTARVRVLVDDPEGLLKPDMFVNVALVRPLGEVAAVPAEAVLVTGTRHIVFVDKGQGVFEPRDVITGALADGYYEIARGVTEGDVVVTSGNFLIDSESRLQGALEAMAPSGTPAEAEGHQHAH